MFIAFTKLRTLHFFLLHCAAHLIIVCVHFASLYSHLQVNVFDPFDDPVRGPYQWIHILVFALNPSSLQCLGNIFTQRLYLYPALCCHPCVTGGCGFHTYCTSLSKLSRCSSSMPSSRLAWWGFLTFRWRSISRRLRQFSIRPSTRWVWKAWEYWGRPTSLNQALATQWWSMSAALDSL